MDADSSPVISFGSDVNATLTETSGMWSGMTYTATYSVTDGNQEAPGIDVMTVSALDMSGNLQVASNLDGLFSVDNLNPTVTALAVGNDMLADANTGSAFTITLTFSEGMGVDEPTIDFPEGTLTSSLTYNGGTWITANTFEAEYTALDAGVEIWDIDVEAVGAVDAVGNDQASDYTEFDVFDIDTRNPTVLLLSANTYNITSANIGTGGFTLATVFDEAMSDGTDPVITFPDEDPTPVITYSGGSSEWLNNTTFSSVYNVATDLITIQDIDVNVANATDAAGNEVEAYDIEDYFDIHTIVSVGNLDELSGVKVFPNPVHTGDVITVEWTDMPGEMSIQLYNVVGQQISKDEINGNVSGRHTIDTSGLSAGMYFVHLNSEKGQLMLNVQVVK
jgi:hypothetical protein